MKRREALQLRVDKIAAGIDRLLIKLPLTRRLRDHMIARDSTSRSPTSKYQETIAIVLAIGTMVLSSMFFVTRLLDYGNWPPTAYSAPNVYNLTQQGVRWDLHYGKSLGCEREDCYRDPSTPSSYFKRQSVLPLREFPIKDWQSGDAVYYRARITIPQNIQDAAAKEPYSLHTILMFAESWDLYLNQQLVFQGTQETMLAPLPAEFIRADGSVDIAIKANIGTLPYQGIANRGDLVIGPRALLSPLTFFSHDNATSLQLLYLLPKLAFCVVFSLLFVFARNNREIGWFLLFGLTSSFELFFRSDYALDLGVKGQTAALLALMARNVSLLVLARFIYSFFRLDIKFVERLIVAGFVLMGIQSFVCLFGVSYSVATRSLDITAIVLKPLVYVSSTVLAVVMAGLLSESERSRMRSRIAFAFAVILFIGTALAFVDLAKLIANTKSLQFNLTIVNLTWVFDLILFIFMAAITGVESALQHAQQRQLQFQLQNLNDRLELASTVQSTLLPEPMQGREESLDFSFHYIPAERMAGDWIFKGSGENGSKRFILGDVTGKGPAAALAVAATIGSLRQKDSQDKGIEETVRDLNYHLFNLFRGKAGTSFCLADVSADGKARIAVHGMAGWLHISTDKIKLISSRGGTLGSQQEVKTSFIDLQLAPGDLLVCFSDGCLEGARPMRKLVDAMGRLDRSIMTSDKLFETIIEIGKESVLPDDKAMVMIKKVA